MRFASLPKVVLSTVTLAAFASLAGCSTPPTGTDVGPGTDVVTPLDGGADIGPTDSNGGDTPTNPMDVQTSPDVVMADVVGTDAMPGTCSISGDVRAHVTEMATMGWSALNRTHGMLMHGCTPGMPATSCLADVPLISDADIGANRSALPAQHLRLLYASTSGSAYWTRISPDGRFVGRGTHVHDLVRNAEVSAAGAMYDPAFFPDNSRFMYQPGGRVCPMSLLTTGTPASVSVTAAPCVGTMVGLYEHLGVSLDGADYWATSAGAAAWDDGGHSPTLVDPPPNMPWSATAQVTLSLMANTGTSFTNVANVSVVTPRQGDAVISPSGRLLMTRVVDGTGRTMTGYVLHRLTATHVGSAVMASVAEIARYCITGAKPAFSLDERWVVMHHYVTAADATELGFTGADDPAFAMYRTQGASNIYLLDLATGTRTRLTNMAPGQYAQYPAFRSDGWMYFIVRTLDATGHALAREHVIASDAALVMP